MSGYDTLVSRGVTRLCHFTKFQKLCDIICSEQGILATSGITFDTKNVTDSKRLDGKIDYVCCSVQYPNSWYLMKAENNDRDPIFKEWVVIFIDPAVLLYRNAKFSPCNAATANGAYICDDINDVEQIFADTLPTWKHSRNASMLPFCPTDGQAEILIEGDIPRNLIIGIGVPDEALAKRVHALLKQVHQTQKRIIISKALFSNEWSNMARNGLVPYEEEYGKI